MYPFRPLKSEPRTLNYQNTVLIHREDDTWLLGYVQNFERDEFFVSFDSITTPPSWIHLQNIWPHNLVSPDFAGAVKEKGHAVVYVALRDEEDGPYRFRPAKLLSTLLSNGLYYVQLDNARYGNCTLLVHRLQITSVLPSQKPPSFDRTHSGFMCVRHVISFENVPSIPVGEEEEEEEDWGEEKEEDWEERFRGWMLTIDHIGCRFHMLFEIEKLIIIYAECYNHEFAIDVMLVHPQIFLKELFEKHHSDVFKFHPADSACTLSCPGILSATCFTDQALELCIGSLSMPLHLDILYTFDLHTQAKMKRVCAAWNLLLTDSATYNNIVIDIEKLERNYIPLRQACSTAYMLGFLTDRTVTAKTRSLTLIKGTLDFRFRECVLTELLQLKSIILPMIILKDWLLLVCTTVPDGKARFGLRCGHLFDYFKVCDNLIVLTTSCSVENIFFNVTFVRPPNEGLDIPEHEREFLKTLVEIQQLEVPEASVLIPRLVFHSKQSAEQIVRIILSAFENNFPAVRSTMYDEVRTVVNRWVLGLKYPDEWGVIRDILSLFNGFHADGSRKVWDDIDLRSLDVFCLNKLTLTFINESFNAKPRTLQRSAQ